MPLSVFSRYDRWYSPIQLFGTSWIFWAAGFTFSCGTTNIRQYASGAGLSFLGLFVGWFFVVCSHDVWGLGG